MCWPALVEQRGITRHFARPIADWGGPAKRALPHPTLEKNGDG